jgi:hypothetical protein
MNLKSVTHSARMAFSTRTSVVDLGSSAAPVMDPPHVAGSAGSTYKTLTDLFSSTMGPGSGGECEYIFYNYF